MARFSFSEYTSFLLNVSNLWSRWGSNFSVRDWPQSRVTETYERLRQIDQKLLDLEIEGELLRAERDARYKEVEGLSVNLLTALNNFFAKDSPEVVGRPRLDKKKVGRPKKGVVTRRKNAALRKQEQQKTAPDEHLLGFEDAV